MVIALDFDKTIHDMDHPVPGRKMGPPLPGALEFVRALRKAGWTKIVLFTVRGDQPYLHEWLKYWGFPDLPITNVKLPIFRYIIDDKAIIRPTSPEGWQQLAKRLIEEERA